MYVKNYLVIIKIIIIQYLYSALKSFKGYRGAVKIVIRTHTNLHTHAHTQTGRTAVVNRYKKRGVM